MLAPFYRSYELAWEDDEESQARFRRILRVALVLLVGFAILIALLPAPRTPPGAATVPPQLARVMIQEQPKPPPPPPPPPKPEVKPVPQVKPVPTPPVDKVAQARRKAEQAGIEQFKDQLADLREKTPIEEGQTKNLTGAVGADSHAERSLITSKVGSASSGITSTSSRGFGTGAGSLTGHETATVTSAIAHSGLNDRGATRTGSSGKAARSREEIELVFDRNKGAIYTLYARALREHPELQGKLVLEFTIAPSGEVTMCRVLSSELHNEELESKIVARVKSFRFEAKDVETITTTKPIDFFPAQGT
ncbi:MAG TPA: AgmX/PglI C-terminal domain-containing protein [Steroidobacteraceae bacterium]|nr:AgmX/PglI C-terminal domain-containing protein [Steroidobacteraceae bacterium]